MVGDRLTCECCATRFLYQLQCLECCARLVASAHPSRRMAGAQLAAIERMPGSPERADVLAGVPRQLESRRKRREAARAKALEELGQMDSL